ncbi:MAG: hypothetical protein AB8F74_02745 [Saprospiraceae bacterium]
MHLNCPSCRYPIVSDDVNLVKTIAKCKSCNNIFEFGENLKGKELPGRFRKEIVIPPGIEILQVIDELEIMVKWRESSKKFTLLFAMMWNGLTLPMTVALMLGAGNGSGGEGFGAVLFMMVFNLVGIYMLYASVGYLVNTTYITVDENRISIDHRPLKFLIQKDKHYDAQDVEQVYVRRYSVGSKNEKPVYAFEVAVKMKNGKTQSIVKELHSPNHARYIEQEIEYFLKIKDRPQLGEWDEGL